MHVKTLNFLLLRQTTTEEIIHQNSQAFLAKDEKEIRLGFYYMCHYLFLHLFLKMDILNQCTVTQQSDKIKYPSKQMDVPVGVRCI